MLTPIQLTVLKKIVGTFHDNDIPYQLTGGAAAIAYGARRETYDLDFSIGRDDILRAQELLMEYLVKDYNHLGNDNYLITLNIDGVPVDIGQVENNCYVSENGKVCIDSNIREAKLIQIDGVQAYVQNLPELLEYKRLMAREIDLEDIRQIKGMGV